MKTSTPVHWLLALTLLAATSCRDKSEKPLAHAEHEEDEHTPTNRIDLPATVQQNLGITFAKVERRNVSATLRVPGQFELSPSARHEYRSTLPGRVHLLVNQFDEVKKGTPVFQMDSPAWHALRKQLHESRAAIEARTTELNVAEQTKREAGAAIETMEQRVSALAAVDVRKADLDGQLAAQRASLPRLDAEIQVKHAALDEARHDFTLEMDRVGSLLGLSTDFLTQPAVFENTTNGHGDHAAQRWYHINKIEMTATGHGIVEGLHVTDGAWVDENTLLVSVIDPAGLRFRATALQSDLARLKDGLAVSIVPPQGNGLNPADAIAATLKVGLAADATRRTIELIAAPQKLAPWARPGVSALMEISVDSSGKDELAIPVSAVVRDELTHIFFRRDPKDRNKVIRVEADLGVSDGKWIVVNSGLKMGDEVVLDGVYELKLAGGGKQASGGHFHADGTFHADGKE